jgi:hypothetical protein
MWSWDTAAVLPKSCKNFNRLDDFRSGWYGPLTKLRHAGRMLRYIMLIAAIFAASTAQAADRRYALSDFDRVIVEGPYLVTLTVGGPSGAIGSGSVQALDGVTVEVQGTTLRIRRNRSAWVGTPGQAIEPATIKLTTRNLRSARMAGTGTLDISGAKGLQVDLIVQGSGQLRARALAADTLMVGLRGAGSLELAGEAKVVTADLQGAGSMNAAALTSETATLAVAISGDASLSVRRAAKVTANGLGATVIGGTPACTISGPSAAQVRCGR